MVKRYFCSYDKNTFLLIKKWDFHYYVYNWIYSAVLLVYTELEAAMKRNSI